MQCKEKDTNYTVDGNTVNSTNNVVGNSLGWADNDDDDDDIILCNHRRRRRGIIINSPSIPLGMVRNSINDNFINFLSTPPVFRHTYDGDVITSPIFDFIISSKRIYKKYSGWYGSRHFFANLSLINSLGAPTNRGTHLLFDVNRNKNPSTFP